MDRSKIIITIDGPAGSGKSTISKLVAEKLNGRRLDTGAIYRSFAWIIDKGDVDQANIELLREKANSMELLMEPNGTIIANGIDITTQIRTPHISELASKLAAIKEVREALFNIQRKSAFPGPTVCEGRDMGSVVFPDAPYKFFLTASSEERARRRYLELKEKGNDVSYDSILQNQIERDKRDTTRAVAPLIAAPDAHNIDSTSMTISEVVEYINNFVFNK